MRRIVIFFSIIAAAALIWAVTLLLPVSTDAKPQMFRVEEGQGVNEISRNLHNAKLIRSSFAFESSLWSLQSEGKIRSGTYSLSPQSNLLQVVDILLAGRFAQGGTVTLIEGWNLNEYRVYLSKQGFSISEFDVLTNSVESNSIDSWKKDYPILSEIDSGRTLEGYLFPDTYAVDADRDTRMLVIKMLDNFDRKLSEELRNAITQQKRSIDEVIILASIVEKEVASTKDRALVADIFLKRLKEGIGLQSDATINYITGSGRSRSTIDDLAIDSPYNTYKYRGLPPGPIGNPGLDAIKAVIYPEANPYYYFLTDAAGTVYYARNFAEHQKNRQEHL